MNMNRTLLYQFVGVIGEIENERIERELKNEKNVNCIHPRGAKILFIHMVVAFQCKQRHLTNLTY
jgi:hypothetical protein